MLSSRPLDLEKSKFHEDRALIKINNKCGYLDKAGHIVIEPEFDDASFFSEGLAAVMQDRKWGFINKQGYMVIEPRFEYVFDFSEGLAAFR